MKTQVLLVALLLTAPALAQEASPLPDVPEFKLEPIPPGEDVIDAIQKGQQAPFTGMLFDPSTALRWGNYIEQARLQAELCYRSWEQTRSAERTYYDGVVELERKAAEELKEDAQQRLKRLEEENARLQGELSKGPPWYQTRTFGVVLGVVGTSALVTVGAVAVSSVK
jgi:hypothetical protein